ncbi:hypothetical protein H1W00_11475 [Aeromicrobium sp. Marseille-Q0843]|uniref:Uncharacterized protein n=1 Tax=Aeromicrobium phoceense TaxID=2754045 RepID=A0A838XJZ3_9ACTN|nr:hypothetical protein [Aeromicrobium phoceense]MBA4609098.1 hypothetical protein [Aeromicrobium phoceense]
MAQNLPDLTPGETDEGEKGFIRASEIFLPDPKTPQEAAHQTASQLNDKGEWIETVYEADGKTPIGHSLIVTVTQGESVD